MVDPPIPRTKTPEAMYIAVELKEWNIHIDWAAV
jgi:hypothetical protein